MVGPNAEEPGPIWVALSRGEAAELMRQLQGVEWRLALLPYGAGLRLLECCHPRVKDVDFDRGEITARGGKGVKASEQTTP